MGWLEELFAVNRRETAKMPCPLLYQQAQECLGHMTPLNAFAALDASLP
jgi:hypothetical protein